MSGLERCFSELEKAALAGERCPSNSGAVRTTSIEELARQGRIRCVVYGCGWRVVEITSGPNAGASTAPPSKTMRPYRTYDAGGVTIDHFRGGRVRPPKPRRQTPSLPTITLRGCL